MEPDVKGESLEDLRSRVRKLEDGVWNLRSWAQVCLKQGSYMDTQEVVNKCNELLRHLDELTR